MTKIHIKCLGGVYIRSGLYTLLYRVGLILLRISLFQLELENKHVWLETIDLTNRFNSSTV